MRCLRYQEEEKLSVVVQCPLSAWLRCSGSDDVISIMKHGGEGLLCNATGLVSHILRQYLHLVVFLR